MISKDPFIEILETILEQALNNEGLDNQYLAQKVALSERQLYRKVKEQTGQSPNQFIRSYRLKKAMDLLESGHYATVQEVGLAVGYQNIHYFSKAFSKEYGESPMQVLKRLNIR